MDQDKTTARDYSREYYRRKETNKRLQANLKRELVEPFQDALKIQEITFSQWLQEKIKDELTKVGN